MLESTDEASPEITSVLSSAHLNSEQDTQTGTNTWLPGVTYGEFPVVSWWVLLPDTDGEYTGVPSVPAPLYVAVI